MRGLLAWLLFSVASIAVEPKPILVVREEGVQNIDGHGSPTLALYSDGTLIWVHNSRVSEEPFHSRKVADAAALAKEILPFDLSKVEKHYSTSEISDQLETLIWTPTGQISVYGNWQRVLRWKRDPDPAHWGKVEYETEPYDAKQWETMPKHIRQSLMKIDEQCRMTGEPWLPETIEVWLAPFQSKDKPVPWPREWPGLQAKEARKGKGRSQIIAFPRSAFPEVRHFVRGLVTGNAPVLIEGQIMFANYRFPFPEEKLWWGGEEPW